MRPGALVRLAASAACGSLLVACAGETQLADPTPKPTAFSSQAPKVILEKAFAATRAVSSFHVIFESGGDEANMRAEFDVRGKECAGSLTFDDVQVQLVHTDDATYQKAARSYWTQQPGAEEVADAVAGRWARSPRIPGLATFCDLDKMLDELQNDLGSSSGRLNAGHVTWNGQQVAEIRSMTLDGALRIEADEPHRILNLDARPEAEFQFSRFDEPVTVRAPTQSVNLRPYLD